ncbi:hypothetical protein WBP06_25055 [Novosphingobium sp. BL-8H]|uniref:sacsin N-terminal ATP-binding-like domain-containing protein n=1 Tax=Novosphingobium sp. BL-8H TaxID=3127640 RepID=UPI0037579FAB
MHGETMTTHSNEMPDLHEVEITPQTVVDWERWIAERVEDTENGYRSKPDLLKHDANAEKSIARDYANRELLELVQNAADAAAEQGGNGRVHIEIRADGFCVANTGMPFRAGGVRSLMTAHLSDKPERGAELIGAKGLGFRALLNWSSEPFVASGPLEIGFSQAHAAAQVAQLAQADARIQKLINRSRRTPIPILPFPASGSLLEKIADPARQRLIARARALRAQGYDTVVAAPFNDEMAHERALKQLAEFQPDFLLFVEAISEITLDDGNEAPRCWTKQAKGHDRFTLKVASGETASEQDWLALRTRGTLPDADEPGGLRRYELAIAVRCGVPTPPGTLHCYFPTDIQLPYPALFHATLELDSSRKTLNANSDVNAGVLAALSRFYADALLAFRDDPEVPHPLTLLARTGLFPDSLKSFEVQVYAAARARPLIPINDGTFATAEETKVEPSAYSTYLPSRFFPALARSRSEADRAVIERLSVDVLEQDDMLAVLRGAEMTIDERASAIVGIAKSVRIDLHDRSLLLDTEGKPLTQNNTSFPPPASGTPPVLPWWAKAKFLHSELWNKISAGLGGVMRDRFDKLQAFGVNEFSASGVIGSLRREANKVIRRQPERTDTVKRELLEALFGLRQTAVAREAVFPAGATEVICADGTWRDASRVHLSAPYGETGGIVSALYQGQSGFLVAGPESYPFSSDVTALREFFRWIGVHGWPKGVEEPVPAAYRPLVIDALPDVFDVVDGNHRSVLTKAELVWGSTYLARFDSVEGLAGILANAPSAAILTWLAFDPRFDTLNPKPFATRLTGRTGRANWKPYSGQLPDLVRHMIAMRPWLTVADGEKVAPCDAMVSPGPLATLFKTPARPSAVEEAQFGLSKAIWARGLIHAQVPDKLSDLAELQIYRLLSGLEKRQPSPDVVRRLYGQILLIDDFDPSRGGDVEARFRATGTVQARKGGAIAWAHVGDVLYLDRDNFPAAARDHLALLDLPTRRNAAEIAARFGVRPLSKQNFSLTVTRAVPEESGIAGHLHTRLQDSLPFIKTLRLANSVDTGKLARLDGLKLEIVKEAVLAFSLGEAVYDGELEPGKYLLDGDRLLIRIDPQENMDEIVMRALTAIGDGLAEFFELQNGDDFEKLLMATNNNLRMLQLRRMLANQTSDEIDALLVAIESEIAAPDEPYAVDAATLALALTPPAPLSLLTAAPPGVVAASNGVPPTMAPPASVEQMTPPVVMPSPSPASVSRLQKATAVTVVDLEPSARSGGGGGGGGLRIGSFPGESSAWQDVSAPNDAEEWAMLFEESQGRFPLRISRLQGEGSYGCDCLSFAGDADRAAFKEAPEAHSDKILRFIEVKTGAVLLTRNEQISAQRNRGRYFIYQIQFDAQGRTTAHLDIVADPLSHRAALVRQCEVRIDQIANRRRHKLSAVAP